MDSVIHLLNNWSLANSAIKSLNNRSPWWIVLQGAKKIIFTVCHSGKLKLAFTSPDVISTRPRSFLMSRIDFNSSSVIEIAQKNITCPSGKLTTEFTSLIAKSTSLGVSDTTFFARWCYPTFEQPAIGAIGFPNAYPWIVIYPVDNAFHVRTTGVSFIYTVS